MLLAFIQQKGDGEVGEALSLKPVVLSLILGALRGRTEPPHVSSP